MRLRRSTTIVFSILLLSWDLQGATPGTLKAFGSNLNGELGDGHSVNDDVGLAPYSAVLAPIKVRDGVRAVASGGYHTLYIKTDGSLWAVGNNTFGQLGDGTRVDHWDPVLVAQAVKAVAAGLGHSLFLKEDGTLWSMGNNGYGQLGDGTGVDHAAPAMIATEVQTIEAGRGQSYFIKKDGSLWSIGYNLLGALGDGTKTDRQRPVQVAVGVAGMAAGDYHCLFVKTDGTLWGMGSNGFGQLGDGSNVEHPTPIQIASGVVQVAASEGSSYYLKTDGSLWGIGDNRNGQLGDSTTIERRSAILVTQSVAAIASRGATALFLKKDTSLWAMGGNEAGQLGDGTNWWRNTPMAIATGVASVTAGGVASFFIKTDGTLWAMGRDGYGQLADGTADERWTPATIASDVVSISAGNAWSMFVTADGTLWGMGANHSGALGDGTTKQHSIPVRIASGVSSVSCGVGGHSLFVKRDGTLWAMGFNHYGQLGIGLPPGGSEDPNPHPTPQQVDTNVALAAAGRDFSLYVKQDGTLWAMGDNHYGQLGDGSTSTSWKPVKIAGGVASVVAGEGHVLFIKTDGTLWAMGDNKYGQLGAGGLQSRSLPVQIASGVVSASAGYGHSLFVKADGTLWAMGANGSGEYDNGSLHYIGWSADSSNLSVSPFRIASDVTSVAAAYNRSFFLKKDGTLWGMGYNWNSQLGDGTTIRGSRYTPIKIASGVSAVAAGTFHTLILNGEHVGATPAISGLGGNIVGQDDQTSPMLFGIKDADTPVDRLQVTATSSDSALLPPSGIMLGGTGEDRTVVLRPGAGMSGFVTVTLTVSDGALTASTFFELEVVAQNGAPRFFDRPLKQEVSAGGTATFYVAATGSPAPTFEWQVSSDGGATWSTVATDATYTVNPAGVLTIEHARTELNGNLYRVVARNSVGATTCPPVLLTVRASTRLVNIAARGFCGVGDRVMIGGYVVSGTAAKRVLIRAVGPSLTSQGLGANEVLLDPLIEVHQGTQVIASNDNWNENANSAEVTSVAAQIGANALATGDTKSSALLLTLSPGVYSFVANSKTGASGIVLLEVYDADTNSPSTFVNISTRAYTTTGNGVTIGGFVISGNAPKQILLRAVGPTLTSLGVTEADVLADPMIELHQGVPVIAANDNWGDNVNSAAIVTTAARIGAVSFGQNDSKSAALLLTLNPGVYTFLGSGRSSTSGIVLIEVYDAD